MYINYFDTVMFIWDVLVKAAATSQFNNLWNVELPINVTCVIWLSIKSIKILVLPPFNQSLRILLNKTC